MWVSGREQLVPRDLVYPPDKSNDEIDEANNHDFNPSEVSAEYAALATEVPAAVTVETVTKDGPSAGKLEEATHRRCQRGPVTDLDQFQGVWKHQARPEVGDRLPPQECPA